MPKNKWLGAALLVVMILLNLWALSIRTDLCSINGPRPRPITWEDDSFYSLTVAYNLYARGVPQIDEEHVTNGFQPLYVWAIGWLPRFASAQLDRVSFIGWALKFQFAFALLLGIGIALVAAVLIPPSRDGTGRRLVAVGLTVTMCFASMQTLRYDTNGLETRMSSVFLVFFIYFYFKSQESRGARRRLGLGVLAALLVYARLDMILFLASFGSGAVLFRRQARSVEIKTWLAVVGISLAILAPYLIRNLLAFDSIVPISGKANVLLGRRSASISATLMGLLKWLVECPVLFYYSGDARYSAAVRYVLSAVFAMLGVGMVCSSEFIRRRCGEARTFGKPLLSESMWILVFAVTVWILLLMVYYGVIQRAGSYGRYMEPLRLVVVTVLSIAIGRIFVRSTGRVPYAGIAVLLLGQGVALWAHAGSFANPRAESDPFIELVDVLERSGLRNETIATFQSGYVGYWLPHVTNLDGKVNGDALTALETGQLGRYAIGKRFSLITDPAAYDFPRFWTARACSMLGLGICDLVNDANVMASYELTPLVGTYRTWLALVPKSNGALNKPVMSQ